MIGLVDICKVKTHTKKKKSAWYNWFSQESGYNEEHMVMCD